MLDESGVKHFVGPENIQNNRGGFRISISGFMINVGFKLVVPQYPGGEGRGLSLFFKYSDKLM